ncbi:MAG: hypothetical protein MJ158_01985, partial [Alphaproteobacteria bacterium]|nr:hypothetical protein [Alphaproteobacteria bacterium]
QISARRSDIPIIAVCSSDFIANQLCICRGVFPIYDGYLFSQRDAFSIAHQFGINFGKLVIVDGDSISLRDID